MNFLAHLFLSGKSEGIIVGNFIGDAVKGNSYNKYPDEIKKGILLHRKIDYFTDNHEIVRESKLKVRSQYGKHAGIVIDIFYDHFLAINWNTYADVGLNEYIQNAYEVLLSHNNVLPDEVMRYLPYMVMNDWLGSYIHIESIKMILNGMSRRTSLPDHTIYAVEVLKKEYKAFNIEFNDFFKEIIAFIKQELDEE